MALFNPSSIAIIGASATEGKVGHDILKNLLTQGFQGKVYPVNPKHEEILDHKSYKSIKDISDPIDLAIIVVPAKVVPIVLKECIEKKVESAVIISAGFGETGTDEGKNLEEEILSVTAGKEKQISVIGPNCLGIIRPSIKMNASFAKELPPAGNITLISQSGAFAVGLMDTSEKEGIGYSTVISIGNKTVMNECDFLEIAAEDPETEVIGFYLESFKDGQRFRDIAKRVAQTKSIVLLKAGVSEQGSKAAASHTGALAGSGAAIDALCAETGIRHAHTTGEFLDFLKVLSAQPSLLSPNIAIITNAGGPGILATDAAAFALQLPSLTEEISKKLEKALPPAASTSNPIDVIGDADVERYKAALEACGDDPNIDGICVLLTPQVMTPCEEIAQAIIDWNEAYPLMPIVTSFLGDESVESANKLLQKNSIPTFDTPERAIKALAALQRKTFNEPKGKHQFDTSGLRSARAAEILEGQNGILSQETVKQLFELYSISLPKQDLATTAEEAVEIAEQIGFPVVAKISSPDILHKTDVGGIRAHLQTADDVHDAFEEIMSNVKKKAPDADIRGILIQQFLTAGNEFIIGSVRDPSFGPLVMVGLGGIYAELLEDTAFRIAPIHEEEVYRMLEELASWKLMLGIRGQKQLNIPALAELLLSISALMLECPQISELDLNPVMVSAKGVAIADGKVVTKTK